jgi:hypothetical protein
MDVFEEKLDMMYATRRACLGKMEAYIEASHEPREAESKTDLEKVYTTGLETNLERSEVIEEHQEVPKEEGAVETYLNTGGLIWGPASSHKVVVTAKETDPG